MDVPVDFPRAALICDRSGSQSDDIPSRALRLSGKFGRYDANAAKIFVVTGHSAGTCVAWVTHYVRQPHSYSVQEDSR